MTICTQTTHTQDNLNCIAEFYCVSYKSTVNTLLISNCKSIKTPFNICFCFSCSSKCSAVQCYFKEFLFKKKKKKGKVLSNFNFN